MILVVDDDDMVRAVASHYLEGAGFSILQAGDGRAALAAFHEHQQEIVAAVLDLTMPKMGGLEVAAALYRLRPDFPVILMSGYTAEEVTAQLGGREVGVFVQKPFKRAAFLTAVRKAMGQ
jgi:CheY-like chemotaxis protein